MITPIICGLITLFALGAISFRNPIYGLLSLVVGFCCVSALMIHEGLAYIGFMMLILYIGAIAILFLFVVMMLNINEESLRPVLRQKRLLLPLMMVPALACVCLLVWQQKPRLLSSLTPSVTFEFYDMADLLYTKYSGGVLVIAFLLLHAMIAILSILGTRKMVDKTSTNYQKIAARTPDNSVSRKSVPLYSGADL